LSLSKYRLESRDLQNGFRIECGMTDITEIYIGTKDNRNEIKGF